MGFIGQEVIREVHGLGEKEKKAIFDFLQGAVYSWCKNRKNEWFSLKDLVGEENFYWEGTPLYALYEKHKAKATAVKDAGKDAGWMLKKVLNDDKRTFETNDGDKEWRRMYLWKGNEI